MSSQTLVSVPSMETIQRAIEGNDANTLINLYADDAQLRIIDKYHTPSQPTVLRGKSAIADYYNDVCARAMSHKVEDAVSDSRHIAFLEDCRYPDGMQVSSTAILEIANDKIVRQTTIQVWDE